jgi:putative transcriptional regulator
VARNLASEITGALEEFSDYLGGRRSRVRETVVRVPEEVDVRAIREKLRLTQAQFAARYALPLHTIRKWEQGNRKPDSASRAYLTMIARNPKLVERTLMG